MSKLCEETSLQNPVVAEFIGHLNANGINSVRFSNVDGGAVPLNVILTVKGYKVAEYNGNKYIAIETVEGPELSAMHVIGYQSLAGYYRTMSETPNGKGVEYTVRTRSKTTPAYRNVESVEDFSSRTPYVSNIRNLFDFVAKTVDEWVRNGQKLRRIARVGKSVAFPNDGNGHKAGDLFADMRNIYELV